MVLFFTAAASSVRTSVSPSRIRLRDLTVLFVVGLKYSLAQMIVITRRCVTRKIPIATFKVNATLIPSSKFVSGSLFCCL